jgi:hypothetical protein
MRRLLCALWIVAVGLCVSFARAQGAGLIQLRNDLGGTPAKPEVVGLLNLALPALSGSGCLDYNGSAWVLATCGGSAPTGSGIPAVISGVYQSVAYSLSGDVVSGTPSGGHIPTTVEGISGASPIPIIPNVLQWESTATPTLNQAQAAGTGSTNGLTFTLQAQQGQQQSGTNANTNGGNLTLISGAAGTGGSGAAGTSGSLILETGSTISSLTLTDQTVSGLFSAGSTNGCWEFINTQTAASNAAYINCAAAFGAAAMYAIGDSTPHGGVAYITPASDHATETLLVQGQNAYPSASTNVNGGLLLLQSGASKTNGTTGLRGPLRLQLGADTAETVLEATEVAVGRRVLALNQVGSGITSTNSPSGDGIAWIGNAQTIPSSNPVGGPELYATGGNLWVYPTSGSAFEIQASAGSITWADDLAGSTNTAQFVAAISGNAGAGGTIPVNATALQFGSTQSSPAVSQANLTTNSGSGQTLTVQAQNETGTTSTGGALNLTSGTGTSTAGALNLQIGGTTEFSINGAKTIATLTPPTLQWPAAASSPTISQVAAASGAGQNFTIAPQSATTTGASGSLVLNVAAPASGTTEAGYVLERAGTTLMTIARYGGAPSLGIWAPAIPSTTNYSLLLASGFSEFNVPSSVGVMGFGMNNNVYLQVSPNGLSGSTTSEWANNSPLLFQDSSVTLATSGTTSLTTTQQANPTITIATVTLTGAATLAIGNVGGAVGTSSAEYDVDISRVTLAGNTLTLTNGSASVVLTTGLANAMPSFRIKCNTNAIQIESLTGISSPIPIANGGTGDTTLTSDGVLYGQGTSAIAATAAPTSGSQQLLGQSSGVPALVTPTWHTTTFCSSGCTHTSSGVTYTPVTNLIQISACPAGGGGGGAPNGTSSSGIGAPPDGGGGGGAGGQLVQLSLPVTAGTAITVNFPVTGGNGGAQSSPSAGDGVQGGSVTLVQSSATIWTLQGASGGTGGSQQGSTVPPIALGGGSITQGGGYIATAWLPFPPSSPGYGGYGGGTSTVGTSTSYQAIKGADSSSFPAASGIGFGGNSGSQGSSSGGYGGGGGGAGYQGNGGQGDNGGTGVSSGTGGNASNSGSAGGLCSGGGGGAAGGASQTGTGGTGTAGHPGGGAWVQFSEYYYRWLDAANDNARPWKPWAREMKRAVNL